MYRSFPGAGSGIVKTVFHKELLLLQKIFHAFFPCLKLLYCAYVERKICAGRADCGYCYGTCTGGAWYCALLRKKLH